jgi:hypothetical protein
MPVIFRRFFLILIFSGAPASLPGYAPLGHEIVGAIADERLTGTATGEKIAALLDGMTLERAAVIADEIKGWTKTESMIRDRFTSRRTGTLTSSCAISGAQINQRTISTRLRRRIIGSITQMFRWSRRRDTVMDVLAAANGTSST